MGQAMNENLQAGRQSDVSRPRSLLCMLWLCISCILIVVVFFQGDLPFGQFADIPPGVLAAWKAAIVGFGGVGIVLGALLRRKTMVATSVILIVGTVFSMTIY